MALVAGVDSSPSGCTVHVCDADSGDVVASGTASHSAPTQDPRQWLDAFTAASEQAGVSDRNRPAAIAVAAQEHALVAVDAAGGVIRPALGGETDTAPDAGWLTKQLEGGAAAWVEACGNAPTAALTITKLSWLHRSEPEAFERMAAALLPHDWLTLRLTGRPTTDRGDASGTGYWSPVDGAYRFDLLAIVDKDKDWDEALPAVLPPFEAAGEWAATGAIVAPGTGASMAAALGTGARPGDVVLTEAAAFAVSERPVVDATGNVLGLADATNRFLGVVRRPTDGGDPLDALRAAGVDISGRVLEPRDTATVVARGAALQAAAVLGSASIDDLTAAWQSGA